MIANARFPQVTNTPTTILIVEDHSGVRAALRDSIHMSFPDARLLEADCAEDALATAAVEGPNIVLMDINLPDMNGIETTRHLKARLPGTCVVMVSNYEDLACRNAARAAGAANFVVKRTLPQGLMTLLDELMRKPHGASALPC